MTWTRSVTICFCADLYETVIISAHRTNWRAISTQNGSNDSSSPDKGGPMRSSFSCCLPLHSLRRLACDYSAGSVALWFAQSIRVRLENTSIRTGRMMSTRMGVSKMPPTTTRASGRWTCAPIAVDRAAGSNPTQAAMQVIMTGRNRVWHACRIAVSRSVPLSISWLK